LEKKISKPKIDDTKKRVKGGFTISPQLHLRLKKIIKEKMIVKD
jgi:hypothetical protein